MYGSFNYKCESCNEYHTRFIKKTEKDKQTCSKCSSTLKQIPSAPPFYFKGGKPT